MLHLVFIKIHTAECGTYGKKSSNFFFFVGFVLHWEIPEVLKWYMMISTKDYTKQYNDSMNYKFNIRTGWVMWKNECHKKKLLLLSLCV